MATAKDVIIDFIVAELRKGNDRGEILSKVVKKWQTNTRTFDRYFKTAKERHTEARQAIESKKAEVILQNEVEGLKRELMQADERKEILTKMARGELAIKRTIVFEGVPIEFNEYPGFTDIKNSIAELNKMDGEYAPAKSEIKHDFDLSKEDVIFQ